MIRKSVFFILAISISLNILGQDNESSQRNSTTKSYLPVAGDIAIGVDAIPYINFLGSMFTAGNSLNLNKSVIYGKYYLSSDAAIRAEFYVNQSTDYDYNYVQDDANVMSNPNAQVEDMRKRINNGFGVGAGFQKFKGNERLRGTYGATASYYSYKYKTEFQWGNDMTASNTNPTNTIWPNSGTAFERNLFVKDNGSSSFSLGLIGGFEFFLLPRICIGAEYGIYYNFNWYSQEYTTFERVEQTQVREYEIATDPRESNFSFSTRVYDSSNAAGRIYLLVHF